MVFGSTSVSEANTVGWERLRSDQSVFTRALLTRNSMSSDWSGQYQRLAHS